MDQVPHIVGEVGHNMQTWEQAQSWEMNWHNNCVNSYQEETKQIDYARRMGLKIEGIDGRYPVINMMGKSVIDMGAGPYSLLLKTINCSGTAIDPGDYPQWVLDRYKAANISYIKSKGEDYCNGVYDECWMYNCLQHTQDPEKIVNNIKNMAKIIRIHEWIDTPISDGHIQSITRKQLDSWLNGKSYSAWELWGNIRQEAYYGIFVGNI